MNISKSIVGDTFFHHMNKQKKYFFLVLLRMSYYLVFHLNLDLEIFIHQGRITIITLSI